MSFIVFQWTILFIILIISNAIAICRKVELFPKNKFVGYDPHNPDYVPADRLENDDLRFIVVSALSVNKENWPAEQTQV